MDLEPDRASRQRKVPELTAYFWIVKILTTAMGEATSDYLVHRFPPVLAVVAGAVVLAFSLVLQFRARRYVASIYWFAVVMVAVFGTMAADVLHVQFAVPYAVSTSLFAVVLAAVLVAWYRAERTLSIHSIDTPRREVFYWLAVMSAFALGTAAGDLTAIDLHLGYFFSGVLFAAFITVPAVAFGLSRLHPIPAFWIAYVLTRPLGASFADWLDKPRGPGLGLGLGTGPVALVLIALIVGLVAYLSLSRRDVPRDARPGSRLQASLGREPV